MKTRDFTVLSFFLLLAIGIIVLRNWEKEKPLVEKVETVFVEIDTVELIRSTLELNDNNVYLWLKVFAVKHDSIVLAQSKLETGNYESSVCLKSNNLFGFLNSNGFYEYRHWLESVIHYAQWQHRLYDGETDYYYFLEEIGYAEDTNYTEKLKKFN